MRTHFIRLEMQKIDDVVRIKPGEIVTISPSPEQNGSRVVTRQNQIFYVKETPEDIEASIFLFFKELNGEF